LSKNRVIVGVAYKATSRARIILTNCIKVNSIYGVFRSLRASSRSGVVSRLIVNYVMSYDCSISSLLEGIRNSELILLGL